MTPVIRQADEFHVVKVRLRHNLVITHLTVPIKFLTRIRLFIVQLYGAAICIKTVYSRESGSALLSAIPRSKFS